MCGSDNCPSARFMELDGARTPVLNRLHQHRSANAGLANTRFTCCVNSRRSPIRAAL